MSRSDSSSDLHGVEVTGDSENQTVVFVHGALFQRKMWVPQRDELDDEFRVVVLDLPGHGTRSGADFEFEQSLELLEEVFETEVDDTAVLVGISLGGYVATEYARRRSEDVDGLVISGSNANPVGRLESATRAVAGMVRLLTESERVVRKLEDLTEEWVRNQDLGAEAESEFIDAGFYPRQLGIAGPEIAGKDFRDAFADYSGPSLVLNGEKDLLNRISESKHATAAENARVEVVPAAGHAANLQNTESYSDAVRRFCKGVYPGQTIGAEGE